MTESINRDLATSLSAAVINDTLTSTGEITGGITVVSNVESLPSGSVGDRAFVTSTDGYYIHSGDGWFQIALINTTPVINSLVDANGDSATSPFVLDTEGATSVITVTATDPEGTPVIYSAVTDTDFDGMATVSQSGQDFTITPLSQESATTESGTITFRASDGVNIATQLTTFTLVYVTITENSSKTALLAKAFGSNGTNTVVPTDASSNNATLTTPSNSPTNQAWSPHHPGGYSAEFNGSNSQITVAHSTDFNIYGYSNGFTIEGWIYPRSYHSSSHGDGIICKNSSSSGWIVRLGTSSGPKLQFVHPGTAGTGPIGNNVPLNEWTHFAFTRATNGDFKYYQNGILVHSFTLSGTNRDTSQTLYVGHESSQSTARFDGYIRDVRISDTIVYSDNFELPVEGLTSTSNTKFLACHLPYIGEGSFAGHILSPSNVTLDRFGPYDYFEYNPVTHGSSMYHESKQYYLSIPNWKDGTTSYSGEFTYEGWFYFTQSSGFSSDVILSEHPNGSNRGLLWYNNSYYAVLASSAASWSAAGGASFGTIREGWHHLALVRDGDVLRPFVNGVQGTTTTLPSNAALNFPNNATFIATGHEGWESTDPFYLSEFRVVWGSALYTSNFTVPTEPLSAVTNTQVLVKPAAPNIFNTAGTSSEITLYGDTKSSTAQTKYASSSMYFDGSGDYVTTTTNDVYTYGTGDFTIEAWIYITANPSSYAYILGQGSTVASAAAFGLYIQSGVFKVYNNGVVITGTTSYNLNTWHHVVLTRGNGKLSLFLDGSLEGSASNTNNITTGTTMGPTIGGWIEPGDAGYFTGYVEDLRITKGLARYPFIPAKTSFSNDSNTDFLTGHAATIVDGSSNSHTITSSGPVVSNTVPVSGMKSIYFDGSNDTMVVPAAAWDRDADYTVECWVYPFNAALSIAMSRNRRAADGIIFGYTNDGYLFLGSGRDNVNEWDLSYTGSVDYRNEWNHFALTYDASEKRYRIFVNGASVFTGTSAYHPGSLNSDFNIGCADTMNSGPIGYGQGYISNYRISDNIRYTNSFTPPTSELLG